MTQAEIDVLEAAEELLKRTKPVPRKVWTVWTDPDDMSTETEWAFRHMSYFTSRQEALLRKVMVLRAQEGE